MDRWTFTGLTGLTFVIGATACAMLGGRDSMSFCDYDCPEPDIIWWHPGREVRSGIPKCLWTIWILSPSSQNDLSAGEVATFSSCRLTIAGTFNPAIPYIIYLSQISVSVSPYPGWINLSSLICLCQTYSLCCSIILEIVPITWPGLSSLLSWPSFQFSSSSSSISPSSTSSELPRLLRLSPIAFNIISHIFLCILAVNPAF